MTSKKPDPTVESKPFKLTDHFEVIEREREKFEVPTERALAIAADVDKQREAALVITETRKESELREVFEEIYDDEVARRQLCPVAECGTELKSMKQALAHMRTHILFEGSWREVRAVANDIERQVFPAVEQHATAAYTAEERALLMKTIRERKMLSQNASEKTIDVVKDS